MSTFIMHSVWLGFQRTPSLVSMAYASKRPLSFDSLIFDDVGNRLVLMNALMKQKV